MCASFFLLSWILCHFSLSLLKDVFIHNFLYYIVVCYSQRSGGAEAGVVLRVLEHCAAVAGEEPRRAASCTHCRVSSIYSKRWPMRKSVRRSRYFMRPPPQAPLRWRTGRGNWCCVHTSCSSCSTGSLMRIRRRSRHNSRLTRSFSLATHSPYAILSIVKIVPSCRLV